jgi:hypothetical protein
MVLHTPAYFLKAIASSVKILWMLAIWGPLALSGKIEAVPGFERYEKGLHLQGIVNHGGRRCQSNQEDYF